ncbi:hypothetical protein HYU15_00655 [Candidatus Woesearchaeota archaeon]|nr:hypothetical protein [Candidatus Woesearchaeota archaeon]
MPKKSARKGAKPKRAGARRATGARKAAKAAKKRASGKRQKPAARAAKPKSRQEKRYETEGVYEETVVMCPGCGRETKVIKLSGISTEGMLCQRCAKGEIEIEDMDF